MPLLANREKGERKENGNMKNSWFEAGFVLKLTRVCTSPGSNYRSQYQWKTNASKLLLSTAQAQKEVRLCHIVVNLRCPCPVKPTSCLCTPASKFTLPSTTVLLPNLPQRFCHFCHYSKTKHLLSLPYFLQFLQCTAAPIFFLRTSFDHRYTKQLFF